MSAIELRATKLCWISDRKEEPDDQCAHGTVLFKINETVFVDDSAEELTLSAAALFLLRTIFNDHNANHSVTDGEFLFPCCGFAVWKNIGSDYPVYIQGCPSGVDVEISHQENQVMIVNEAGKQTVSKRDYINSVLRFVNTIEGFYNSCNQKDICDDEMDREGWQLFWQEWRELTEQAQGLLA